MGLLGHWLGRLRCVYRPSRVGLDEERFLLLAPSRSPSGLQLLRGMSLVEMVVTAG